MNLFSETLFPVSPMVATIGFFDGVHCGHQLLLNRLLTLAQEKSSSALVVTFSNHPHELFHPDTPIAMLSTTSEKVKLLEHFGIHNCLLLDFTPMLAKLTAEQFILYLKSNFQVNTLLLGYDHHFGSDRMNDFEYYFQLGAKHGVQMVQGEPYYHDNVEVSSSLIRSSLLNGFVDDANRYLGYRYRFSGTVVLGNQIGRTIGFPTANLEITDRKLLPQKGVYAALVHHRGTLYPGMLNIGVRPTVDGLTRTIEVHIFDFNQTIYGEEIVIELVAYIREEKRFDSLEDLKQQLFLDKETTIALFKAI